MNREQILTEGFDRIRDAFMGADLDDFETCQDIAYEVKLVLADTELALTNLEHEQRKENS